MGIKLHGAEPQNTEQGIKNVEVLKNKKLHNSTFLNRYSIFKAVLILY